MLQLTGRTGIAAGPAAEATKRVLMPRHTRIIAAMIALAALSCSEQGPTSDDQGSVSDHDEQLQEKREAWYQRQVGQDCPPGPYDEEAIEAVRRAHQGDKRQFVYGPSDPYNRRASVLRSLKTRRNPKGEGVLVTFWEDANRQGSADYSRKRSVWLFLD